MDLHRYLTPSKFIWCSKFLYFLLIYVFTYSCIYMYYFVWSNRVTMFHASCIMNFNTLSAGKLAAHLQNRFWTFELLFLYEHWHIFIRCHIFFSWAQFNKGIIGSENGVAPKSRHAMISTNTGCNRRRWKNRFIHLQHFAWTISLSFCHNGMKSICIYIYIYID